MFICFNTYNLSHMKPWKSHKTWFKELMYRRKKLEKGSYWYTLFHNIMAVWHPDPYFAGGIHENMSFERANPDNLNLGLNDFKAFADLFLNSDRLQKEQEGKEEIVAKEKQMGNAVMDV